jgi:hypothetical protein
LSSKDRIMPYKSEAQEGYFHTHEAELKRQGVDVAEWDRATKGKSLPRRARESGGSNDTNVPYDTLYTPGSGKAYSPEPPTHEGHTAVSGQDFPRTDMSRFEANARPSNNVEDERGWHGTRTYDIGPFQVAETQGYNGGQALPSYPSYPKNPDYHLGDSGETFPGPPAGYGGGWDPHGGTVIPDDSPGQYTVPRAHGGALTGVGRAEHAVQLAKRMAAGGFDPMGKPGVSSMGSIFEGPIRTKGAGRTDVNKHDVSAGSYVLPADAVSIAGDGNTEGGFGFFKSFFKPLDRQPLDLTGGMSAQGTPMKASGVKKPGLNLTPPAAKMPSHPGAAKRAEGGVDDGDGQTVPIIDAGGEIVVPPRLLVAKFGSLDHGHNTMDEIVSLLRKQEIERLKTAPPPKK